ncbi:hypothetical protein MMPV_005658 [Pyropia vietnamensis]
MGQGCPTPLATAGQAGRSGLGSGGNATPTGTRGQYPRPLRQRPLPPPAKRSRPRGGASAMGAAMAVAAAARRPPNDFDDSWPAHWVVMLTNLVPAGAAADADLAGKVRAECERYGVVAEVAVDEGAAGEGECPDAATDAAAVAVAADVMTAGSSSSVLHTGHGAPPTAAVVVADADVHKTIVRGAPPTAVAAGGGAGVPKVTVRVAFASAADAAVASVALDGHYFGGRCVQAAMAPAPLPAARSCSVSEDGGGNGWAVDDAVVGATAVWDGDWDGEGRQPAVAPVPGAAASGGDQPRPVTGSLSTRHAHGDGGAHAAAATATEVVGAAATNPLGGETPAIDEAGWIARRRRPDRHRQSAGDTSSDEDGWAAPTGGVGFGGRRSRGAIARSTSAGGWLTGRATVRRPL